eukprot:COSAG04_NODE_661_length_11448_cov_24.495903_5_plen_90_part_00
MWRSFGILLVCVVLQAAKTGLATEALQMEGYGYCQVILAAAILPVTLYVIRMNVVDLREQAREHLEQLGETDDETVVKNPLTESDGAED